MTDNEILEKIKNLYESEEASVCECVDRVVDALQEQNLELLPNMTVDDYKKYLVVKFVCGT